MIEIKVFYVMGALFAIAGAFIFVAGIFRPRKLSEIWQAYSVELVIVATISVPIYLGKMALLFLIIFGSRCVYEMSQAVKKMGYSHNTHVVVSITILCVVGAFFQQYYLLISIFLLLILCLLIFAISKGKILPRFAGILLCLAYPTAFFTHFVLLVSLEGGFRYVMFLYVIVEVNDSAAYLVGQFFGKTLIFPSISPNKTYEGSMAGLLAAFVAGFCMWFCVPEFQWWHMAIIVTTLSVFGPLGDITASKIKRVATIKDFSNIVPTKGGVLDVMDALIFNAPIFYYFLFLLSQNLLETIPFPNKRRTFRK